MEGPGGQCCNGADVTGQIVYSAVARTVEEGCEHLFGVDIVADGCIAADAPVGVKFAFQLIGNLSP